ncbi:MAG: RICIN domain-containing protein [SAR202 cluster bacterium]|jgi:hypothetical protein|nr:RICIN domain-containing protein [SAR202 cluster bacterium]MDP6301410.1 RICIN domain-containing protein [SAR202 cluster bacterium]MDP7104920.1 RICIN domain-containing protein [SAR202 cluster bacterium]MDP7226762.1 RICIN domain-containing protein [SAR202 cluster bacterium]MDP7413012.1 RICIN domain-containing protein [SAR202 cluster bacterium]|tara:strand:+ start:2522 stop:3127 length:606 start_codon:yes stop_codon:yes gene_type:complete
MKSLARKSRRTVIWVALLALAVLAVGCSGPDDSEPTAALAPIIAPPTTPSLVRLVDPLDEPEGYCLDIPGAGSGVQIDANFQAHTCKIDDLADETFTWDAGSGQMRMDEYDMCVEASSSDPGSVVYLARCSENPLQRFAHGADGAIRLTEGDGRELCLAIALGEGIPTGGPSHLRRDVSFERCDDLESDQSTWTFPGLAPL